MKKLLLLTLSSVLLLTACKDDEINTQQKNSTWLINNVRHNTDYTYGTGRWIVATENKDGKIAEINVTFPGNSLPTQPGSYRVVSQATNPYEISITTFANSQQDSLWYSAGTDTNYAKVTFINNKLNVVVENAKMVSKLDTGSLRLWCNLKQR